jgi:transcriptional regulator with XRE-family HTH domain
MVTTSPPFPAQLRHERELRGWSQADLAERVRCDTKTVGRWENGESLPRPHHRQLLCEAFGKNAEEPGLMHNDNALYHSQETAASSETRSTQPQSLDIEIVLRQLKQADDNIYTFIFRQSWERLSSTAQLILIYIGKSVATTVSWEELAGIGIAPHERELRMAVRQLVDYALLDVYTFAGQERYGIHQLSRQFINSDLPRLWKARERV